MFYMFYTVNSFKEMTFLKSVNKCYIKNNKLL